MEKVNQYFKDRTESFDDYYPCMQIEYCNSLHVHNWIQFSIFIYIDTIYKIIFSIQLQEEVNLY